MKNERFMKTLQIKSNVQLRSKIKAQTFRKTVRDSFLTTLYSIRETPLNKYEKFFEEKFWRVRKWGSWK